MKSALVTLSNLATRARRTRVQPAEVLLLLPSCLQWSRCEQPVRSDPATCKRCGRCNMGDLVTMAEELGIQIAVATGGRVAVARARDKRIKAIVAVACSKELRQGVLATFPKAVLGVYNRWPNGPCTDTRVDVDSVRKAVEWFLR